MQTVDIAVLVIAIAIFALIPIGCIMTRKSKTSPDIEKEPPPTIEADY